jgi:hypothetical protein
MITPAPRPGRPSPREISELIAWARRLSDAGIAGVPAAELAAYQAAKHDLLARINTPEREDQ